MRITTFNLVKQKGILFSILFLISNIISAQITGTSGYIKGSFVEIGVNGIGGFEGASGVAPVGTHFRGGASGFQGFVANPQLDGWANWNGDYFTPGSPENGWGLQIGGTNYSNNCVGEFGINGSLTNYSHILDCYNLDWEGTALLGTNTIKTKINYFLQENDLFYTTTIVLTNLSTTSIPLMYYYRNVDPDNNESLSFNFATQNTIEDQAGGVSGCQLACVSASQAATAGSSVSYMAFAAVGSDYRVSHGGFSNRIASDIWNGTGGLIGTLGSSVNEDLAISLAFRIQNFLPGTSRTIKFVTILNSADKNKALANLLYLTYPGSTFYPPSVCSNVIDTIKACGGSTYIQVDGPNVADYNWSWNPTTFLSSPLTYSTFCTPTTTIVYTVTGTPISTVCVSPLPLTYTIAVKPYPPMGFTITPGDSVKTCIGVAVSFTASGGTNYSWTGPGGYSGTTGAVVITPTTVISSGVYTALATNTLTGCSASGTIHVTVYPNPIISTISSTICAGQTASLTASGADTYTWSPGVGSGNPVAVTPSITTTYSVNGTYTLNGCKSSKTATVTVIPNAVADFSGLFAGQTFTIGDTLHLTNTSTNFTSFNWTLCDGSNSISPTITIPLPKIESCCIKLVATKGLCKDSIINCFNVISNFYILIPNVFTPNGDNANDVFKILVNGVKEDMNVGIYNRWGTKMYEWNGTTGFWDGNAKSGPAAAGTYFYILNYTKIDGGESKTEKGFFNLFR